MDGDGGTVWGKAFGLPHCHETIQELTITPEGQLLIVGDFRDHMQLDAFNLVNTTGCVWELGYIAQLDTDGEAQWVKTAGGNDRHDSFTRVVAAGNAIYAAGRFNSNPAVFDDFSINANDAYHDMFICRLSQPLGTTVEDHVMERGMLVYPNPAEDRLTIGTTSEILKCTAFNSAGQQLELPVLGVRDVSVRSLAPGMYMLQLETRDGAIIMARVIRE